MPQYRTCDLNVDRYGEDGNYNDAEHAAVIAWLCQSDNRVDLRGSRASFLEDVHDSFHDRGYLTELQVRGVQRWMDRAQRRPLRPAGVVSEGADLESASVFQERLDDYDGPHDLTGRWDDSHSRLGALWNQAQWVLSGEYMVRYGTTFSYRIHTIRSSSSNSGLVGKRVVSVYQNERWVTFAFVSRTGHLVLWSRHQDMAEEVFVHAAEALIESFRSEDRATASGASWYMDYSNRRYHITRETIMCRCCNGDMSHESIEDRQQGVHDRDCSQDRVSAIRNSIPDATPSAPPRRVRRVAPLASTYEAPVVASTPQVSELGTGWLQ